MKVGIGGSREGVASSRPALWVSALFDKYPDAIVVSGGAPGVDKVAEGTARGLGMGVLSLRTYQAQSGHWGVERWDFGASIRGVVRLDRETALFEDQRSALLYRTMRIVEEADEHVAVFWNGRSPGTALMIDVARGDESKSLHLYQS